MVLRQDLWSLEVVRPPVNTPAASIHLALDLLTSSYSWKHRSRHLRCHVGNDHVNSPSKHTQLHVEMIISSSKERELEKEKETAQT